MAKLTKEQVRRLRKHWGVGDKHLHISPDGKIIESDEPSYHWWCIDKNFLLFNGNNPQKIISSKDMEALVKRMFQDMDTEILEIYYALNGGYSK